MGNLRGAFKSFGSWQSQWRSCWISKRASAKRLCVPERNRRMSRHWMTDGLFLRIRVSFWFLPIYQFIRRLHVSAWCSYIYITYLYVCDPQTLCYIRVRRLRWALVIVIRAVWTYIDHIPVVFHSIGNIPKTLCYIRVRRLSFPFYRNQTPLSDSVSFTVKAQLLHFKGLCHIDWWSKTYIQVICNPLTMHCWLHDQWCQH